MKPLITFAAGLAEKLFGRKPAGTNPWKDRPKSRQSPARRISSASRPCVEATVKDRRHQYHAAGRAANLEKRAESREQRGSDDEFARRLNKLRNWMRHRWARDGYPGLKDRDPDVFLKYATPRFFGLDYGPETLGELITEQLKVAS